MIKITIKLIFVSFVFLFNSCNSNKDEASLVSLKVVELWKTDNVFKTPECAIYDSINKSIYVSNINENPRQKDENGFISKISKDGKKVEIEWVKGLSSPKGMGLFNNILYVTDTDEIVAIDVNKAEIIKNIPFPKVGMLNDITIDKEGRIYTSDMDSNKIFTFFEDEIKLWKSEIEKPNGLLIDGNELLVASFNSGQLISYNIINQDSKIIGKGLGKADGIVKVGPGSFIVSDWNGELFFVKNVNSQSIFNGKISGVQTADLGIIEEENIVIVPTFSDNRLIAFKFYNEVDSK